MIPAHVPATGGFGTELQRKELYDSAVSTSFKPQAMMELSPCPSTPVQPGDHLVELSSDAYCSYVLRFSLTETAI